MAPLTEAPNPATPPTEQEQHDLVAQFIEDLQAEWDKEVPEGPTPWWHFWGVHVTCHKVTLFLLNCLDFLILEVDKLLLEGKAKKGLVLSVINTLYDYIVQGALPIWARPFSAVIKHCIVNIVISDAIDFTVAKYHNAIWPKPVT